MVYLECRAPVDVLGEEARRKSQAAVCVRLERSDMDRLYTLAQSCVPDSVRWAEPMYRSLFRCECSSAICRTGSAANSMCGASSKAVDQICAARRCWRSNAGERWARLHLWIVPTHAGRSTKTLLIDSVLAELDDSDSIWSSARMPGEAHRADVWH